MQASDFTEYEPTLVIPFGKFRLGRQKDMLVEFTPEIAEKVVDEWEKKGIECGIDVEGIVGRPVGWCVLERRGDGLWARDIRLGSSGKWAVSSCPHLAPLFVVDGERVARVLCLSLTRNPQRWEMAA